jgi:hypothetical protein
MWGEIATDRKALITFNLEEENAKIHIYAFPRENVMLIANRKLQPPVSP